MSRTFVAVARLTLLLLATASGLAAVVITQRDVSSQVGTARYGCPMHPEVHSEKPGQCPICRMALEPTKSGMSSVPEGAMPGMADLSAVENVRKHRVLDFVRMRALPIEVRELRGAAWMAPDRTLSAVFYTDQANVIAPDDLATFTPTQAPETTFALRLIPGPHTAWDSSSTLLHFELKAQEPSKLPAPPPGQVGWVEVQRKPRSVLTVPVDAILQSPEGPYVLRAVGGFKFEKRSIQIAETFTKQGIAVLLSGLEPQDRVVARASFFLDADRRLQSGGAEQDWGTR